MPVFPPIVELVAHEPPALLLDEVVRSDADAVACSTTLGNHEHCVEGGSAQAIVCLELMAQATAVYAGLRDRERGDAPRVGFLIGCRELALHRDRVGADEPLTVEATRVWGDRRVGSFRCRTRIDDEVIAEATLNVAVSPAAAEGRA